jgi:hypothetical protein
VVLQRDGEPVRGGAGEAGAGHQAGERRRAGLERGEHERGFVENPDATRVVHALILPYRMMRHKC